MPVLEVINSRLGPRFIELGERELIIGRTEICDVVLSSHMVSRRHARIFRQSDGYYLEDLHSSNGTFLNRECLSAATLLSHGDRFSIHDTQFRFLEQTPNESEAEQPREEKTKSVFVESENTGMQTLGTLAQDPRDFETHASARLRAVLEMTRCIGASLSLDDVLTKILDGVFRLFPDADHGYILLFDRETNQLVPYAMKFGDHVRDASKTMTPISQTIARQVITAGTGILSSDATADDRFRKSGSVHEIGIRSMMAAPLTGPSQTPLGVIQLSREDNPFAFEMTDLDMLISAAVLAGQAVEYAQMHDARLKERHQADERFRLLIESAPDAMVITDEAGAIQLVNAQTEKLFGYSRVELVGQPVDMLVPERLRKQHPFHRRKNSDSPHIQPKGRGSQLFGLRNDGQEFPVQISLNPLETEEGMLVISAIRDMTALVRAHEQVLQSQRLAVIGEMVAGLAHESRNALQRTQSCLEILDIQVAHLPKAVELIHRIQEAQDQLHRLYDEVRNYSTPIKPDRKVCDLNQLLQDVWRQLEPTKKDRDVKLTIRTNLSDCQCYVDDFKIAQVIRNIFENSLAACTDPVQVTATLRNTTLDGHSAITVMFVDNGPGLSEEQCRRMFEPFYSTKTQGAGLGMSIAERIIEAHGGAISASNHPEQGAAISIVLPRRGT